MCVVFQHVLKFMCLLVFNPSIPHPPFFSHSAAECLSLSLGPSIILWTRLLGTNLVFSPHSAPPPPSPVISPCLHLNPVPLKNTKPPSHHTGTTNCRIPLQWISCPTFPFPLLSEECRPAPALEFNWSRKLFHCNKRLMITAVMRPYCTCQDESSPLP